MCLDNQNNSTISSKYSSFISETTTAVASSTAAASSTGAHSVTATDTIRCYELWMEDDTFADFLARIATSCVSCRKITMQAGEIKI